MQDPSLLTAPEIVGRLGATERSAFVADLLEVREALAGVIGHRAADVLTDEHRDQLAGLVRAIDEAATARERQLLELGFFAVLVQAAGNRAIAVLLQWVEQVYENLDLPSIEGAFADGTAVASRLRTLVDVIDDDGDLGSAMTAYARETASAIQAAVAG